VISEPQVLERVVVSRVGVHWARGFGAPGAALAALLVCGCSASIAGPDHEHPGLLVTPIEEDEAPANEVSPSTAPAPTRPPDRHDLPDPAPLTSTVYWEYRLQFREGATEVAKVERRVFESPVVTQRNIGRFAIELWIGRELIERVRFDFPLLGAESPPTGAQSVREAPRFEPGLEAERIVLVPSSDRATRAQLVDRATGKVQALPWPPDAPLDTVPATSVSAPGPAEPHSIPE
jgi:hypothetical protein